MEPWRLASAGTCFINASPSRDAGGLSIVMLKSSEEVRGLTDDRVIRESVESLRVRALLEGAGEKALRRELEARGVKGCRGRSPDMEARKMFLGVPIASLVECENMLRPRDDRSSILRAENGVPGVRRAGEPTEPSVEAKRDLGVLWAGSMLAIVRWPATAEVSRRVKGLGDARTRLSEMEQRCKAKTRWMRMKMSCNIEAKKRHGSNGDDWDDGVMEIGEPSPQRGTASE